LGRPYNDIKFKIFKHYRLTACVTNLASLSRRTNLEGVNRLQRIILDLEERRQEEDEENCIIRRTISRNLHQVLLGTSCVWDLRDALQEPEI